MANLFKITRDQDMTHVSAINIVNLVGSRSHNLGAMTKQTTGKTGRKRIDNIEHFNIDPTSLLDDNARQHKKPKVLLLGTIAKQDAIDSVVSLEARMEEVVSDPSLCYPFLQNVQSALGTQTMVSNNEDMTLSVSTRGLHLIVQNILKEKLFRKLKFVDKRKHGSYSTKTNTVCGMLIKFNL